MALRHGACSQVDSGANSLPSARHTGRFISSPSDVDGEDVPQGRSLEASQRQGWWRHSVVWAHFAKGQTKARDLDLPGLG